MIIDLFSILPLTCALFVFLFGVYIFFINYRSPIHQLLFGFTISMVIWQFGTFMMFATRATPLSAVFWDRIVYAGVVFMPPLMHHFSLHFTKRQGQQKNLLYVNYYLAFLFLLMTQSPYFVDGIYVYSWGAHSKAQILHHVFLGYFFLGTGLFFYNVWTYFRQLKEHLLRVQTIYVFLSFAIVIFIGGSAYLHAYGIDTRFPFAYFSGLIFPLMLGYAVTRHQLLDTKVLSTELLVGIAEFFLVAQIFLAKNSAEIGVRLVIILVVTVIGVFLIKSVRKEVQRREEVTLLAESLERANLRLQELDRQKTEFLSIASHQLRTPLSIINGYVELISDGAYGKVGRKMKVILGNIDESNGRLVKLVDEFLDITRIEQGRTKFVFKEANISLVIKSAIDELDNRAVQKELKIQRPPLRPLLFVFDEDKIRHVIFNFIDNAIKYTDKGSIVVVVGEEEGGVVVRVQDKGLGFNRVDEVSFFQKFYRGENVKGVNVTGTGLGLYVCRMFIESHHGRVWAKSKGLGKGSEFGFWLPLNLEPAHEVLVTAPVV